MADSWSDDEEDQGTNDAAKRNSFMQMMQNNVDNTNFQAVPCLICNGLVEFLQQQKIDGKVYHKNCFRCQQCNKVLLPANYAGIEGKFYCKPHFKQLFATKGNYSEGFGLEQHKNKWNPLNGAPTSAEDQQKTDD